MDEENVDIVRSYAHLYSRRAFGPAKYLESQVIGLGFDELLDLATNADKSLAIIELRECHAKFRLPFTA